MFNRSGMMGEGFEQIGETVQQLGRTAKQAPQDFSKTTTQQVGGGNQSPADSKQQKAEPSYVADFVEQLYAPTQQHLQQPQPVQLADPNNPQSADQAQQQAAKQEEDQKKLLALRNQLHKEYYEKLVAYEKGQQKPSLQEEEKKEEEQKKQQMDVMQKEEKKKELPINMRPKGTGEAKLGVGG